MTVVLGELDKEKFNKNIFASLQADEFYEKCYTNFKEILIETLIDTISGILEKNEWCLQSFNRDKSEKLFNSFIENSEITVGLHKRLDGLNYTFKEIIVKFNFSIEEKKKIAEIYLDKVLNNSFYCNECIFDNLEEKSIYIITELLSDEVYQLLGPGEIKTKFKEKLDKIINNKE